MMETESSRKILFNPGRVEDYITDLTIEFDSAPVGRYDDRAKLGSIAKRTDNPGLLAFARDWVRNGIPTAGGARIDWQQATWAQAKDALRLTYPAPDEAEQSAEILDDFTQTERTSQHSANWLRHREQAGAVIDLESESLLLKKAYSSTLSNYLPPSCRKHELESIQFEIDELIALGSLKRMKHVMAKADQFDTLYNKRWKTAKAQGLLVGAAGYWQAPTSSKTTKPIKAVTQDLFQDQYEQSNIHQIATNTTAMHPAASTTVRLDGLEREAIRMKTQIHQFQTDIKGSVDTLKVDFDKRLKIVETTTDATQTMCQQILNNQMKPPVQANSPTSYPAAETHSQGSYYANPNTNYYQNQGKGYGGGKGYYGGGKGGKGRPRGACYGCGARDHQVASCPKINNQNAPGYLGTARVNAVAGDVLASANAINYGGTKEISDWELHEQMEDGEGEHDATTIAHIAIGWATNILSPQTGNSCALKSKPKILVPQVQLTHGVKKQLAPNNARSKHIFGTCTTCTTDCTTEQNHRLQTDCGHDDDKTASEVKQDAKVISPANGEITESAVFDITHRDKNKILSWLLKHVVSDDDLHQMVQILRQMNHVQ